MNRQYAEQCAKRLVAQMTVEEKASQLLYVSPAIERLGIQEYNWWNEASHGVARAGTATVFPHAIALAATFDQELLGRIGAAVADEARAKYNQSIKFGDRDIYKGLTFWTPNMNVFRDPHWGRGQETFGEDPFLIASMSCEYIAGLQGDGAFLKAAACAKHLAVHSGPEALRHSFDAVVSAKDLWETYLPAFEWTIGHSQVAGVMGAYNRLNGVPCCCSEELLSCILRERWDFRGYVVSDCGALRDVSEGHHYTSSDVESAALALRSGCQLNCGWAYEKLMEAYEMDLIDEEDITAAAEKLYTIRALLGEFEDKPPYLNIPYSVVDCKKHQELNLQAARAGMVLLKNDKGFLPLKKEQVPSIAVIGPNSMNVTALEGNYNGYASQYITVADGIRQVFSASQVTVSKGCHMWYESRNEWNGFGNIHSDGLAAAANSRLAVLVLGLDSSIEGEDGCVSGGYTANGDKLNLYLPQTQQKLAEAICEVCENVVVVLMSGGSLDVGEKLRAHAKAIIQAWYPGALGGLALAQLLAGEYSPSGKLPVTFYYGDSGLPGFSDYSMQGRTYRYASGKVLYPFGYGLSYTRFALSHLRVAEAKDGWVATVDVRNLGSMASSEIIQAYASYQDSRTVTPHYQLCGTQRVYLAPQEAASVTLNLHSYWLMAVLPNGQRVTPDGEITLYVGTHQPDRCSESLTKDRCLSHRLQ